MENNGITVFAPKPGEPQHQVTPAAAAFFMDTAKQAAQAALQEVRAGTTETILQAVEGLAETGKFTSVQEICDFLREINGI